MIVSKQKGYHFDIHNEKYPSSFFLNVINNKNGVTMKLISNIIKLLVERCKEIDVTNLKNTSIIDSFKMEYANSEQGNSFNKHDDKEMVVLIS